MPLSLSATGWLTWKRAIRGRSYRATFASPSISQWDLVVQHQPRATEIWMSLSGGSGILAKHVTVSFWNVL